MADLPPSARGARARHDPELERHRAALARSQRTFRVPRADFLGELRRQPLDPDVADRSAAHLAVLHQVVDDLLREVARDREADSLVAAALAEDAGVEADQLAA